MKIINCVGHKDYFNFAFIFHLYSFVTEAILLIHQRRL